MARGSTAQRALDVVALIRAAAEAGQECPKNEVLALDLGVQAVNLVTRAIVEAERRGLIVVARFTRSRIVAAPDGSWRTADPAHHSRTTHSAYAGRIAGGQARA